MINIARPPWNYVLLSIGGVITITPKFISLYYEWLDAKTGKRQFEHEKARLEIIKLRCEIETFKKQLGFSDTEEPESAPLFAMPEKPLLSEHARLVTERKETAKEKAATLPLWRQRIRAGWLLFCQIFVGLFLICSTMSIVILPFIYIQVGEDFGLVIGAGATYAIIAYLSYLGYKKIRKLRQGHNIVFRHDAAPTA